MAETDTVDQISELPDHIIHQIMSYLSTKEVARTSILSKRWNYLRTSFPILDFVQNVFWTVDSSTFRRRVKEFVEFVDVSVNRFCNLKFPMQKFILYMTLLVGEEAESSSLVDKWIALAVENKVKELDIAVLGVVHWEVGFPISAYTLPSTIFSARFLTALKLTCCEIKKPMDNIRFDSLRKLTLIHVYINEELVRKLTSECPLLEDMVFDMCWGFKCFCISNLKLKIVEIHGSLDELESVKIICPNLESVSISSDQLKKIEVYGCQNLKAIDFHAPNLRSFVSTNRPWRASFHHSHDLVAASYHSIREFLGKSIPIEDLTISFVKAENSFNLDYQVREWFPSLPREIGNLHLSAIVPPSNCSTWLDGFLWLCFPKTLTLATSLDGDYKFIEESYKELKNRNTNCCDSHHIRCWRHYLKDLKIENFTYFSGEVYDASRLMDVEPWPNLPPGCLTFHLEWCSFIYA